MTRQDWQSLGPYFLALFLAVLLGIGVARADDPHHNNDGGGDIDIDIGGPGVDINANPTTNVEANPNMQVSGSTYSSRALAIGNSLGDVDINDCLGSEQFGTPIYSRQWLELNKWCAAEVFDAKGMPAMAARLRCQVKEIRDLYGKGQEQHDVCLAENTAPAAAFEATVMPAAVAESVQILEETEQEHEYQLAQVMQRQVELEDRLKREGANRRAAAAKVHTQQQEQAQAEAAYTEQFLAEFLEVQTKAPEK